MALLVHAVLSAGVSGADRTRPFRIGALTSSWGPTPMIVGMRAGLLKLGYREDIGFCCSACFTPVNINAFYAAATRVGAIRVDLNREVYSERTGSSSGRW